MGITTISIIGKDGEQVLHIPANMHIDDSKVYVKKIGNALYIIPFHHPWQNMFDATFTQDFMEDRQQPDTQKREGLD